MIKQKDKHQLIQKYKIFYYKKNTTGILQNYFKGLTSYVSDNISRLPITERLSYQVPNRRELDQKKVVVCKTSSKIPYKAQM